MNGEKDSSLDPSETGKRHAEDNDQSPSKKIREDSPTELKENNMKQRRKLRKFALLICYCGKNYLGMQRNPGYKTIEDELLNAMLRANLISEEVCTCPQISRFQRAARTDKGVSAVRQVISMKLPDDVELPPTINNGLPEEIRILKAIRVTQKFDAKHQCDCRTYSYTTPTFAFAPSEKETTENYRISSSILEELRSVLNIYKGTHKFHNFTAKVKSNEERAKRFIMNIECGEPFVREDLEWIIIKITGQSFMLHQIRKMIGLAMAICRGLVTRDVFVKAWKPERCDIPIAPGIGLVLEEPHYKYYNKKYGNDGMHEKLEWISEDGVVEAFRKKYIESVIVDTEKKEKVTLNWLQTLPLHTFDTRSRDSTSNENSVNEHPENFKGNSDLTTSHSTSEKVVFENS